jgi:hypothetical protein
MVALAQRHRTAIGLASITSMLNSGTSGKPYSMCRLMWCKIQFMSGAFKTTVLSRDAAARIRL